MKQKSNVFKLKQKNPAFSENTVLLSNLEQVLSAVVKRHGGSVTLNAVKAMILDAQRTQRAQNLKDNSDWTFDRSMSLKKKGGNNG